MFGPRALLRCGFLMALLCGLGRSEEGLNCVEELTVPKFFPGLMSVPLGTASISVTIGAEGRATAAQISSTNVSLKLHLTTYFVDRTRYALSCVGKTVTFTVEYVILKEEPVASPVATVRLRPPNHFVVEFPPMKPIGDKFPNKKGL